MIEQENSNISPEEFDGGGFVITHLSFSPEGFEFATNCAVRRREFPSAYPLDETQRTRLQSAVKREMQFNDVSSVASAKDGYNNAKQSGSGEESAFEEYNKKRKRYVEKMAGKIGIRKISQEGNVLKADVKLVSFPVYNEFSGPTDKPEVLDLSSLVGTAMILRSADGRLIVQHRAVEKQRLHEEKPSKGNAAYSDIPGASVAGMLDASINSHERLPGTPDAIDTGSIKNNIFKEAGEELGLDPQDLKKIRVVGIAKDNVKIHDEILLLADSNLTSRQIEEKSRVSNRNKNLGDADFEEKFFHIEATPEAVELLLTDVKSPLPPTHSAAFVAAGYSMVLQEQGLDAANQWKAHLEKKIQENYQTINETVSRFYQKYPEALRQIPERFWGKNVPVRNPNAYSPAYTPEEQGLPGFEDEMERTNLLSEKRKQVAAAYLFDVDGVLTDPKEKKVTDELLESLAKRLARGEPVGLNSGRSNEWMIEKIIKPLLERIEDKSVLGNFVAIGEKGGTWITFDENGNMREGRSGKIVIHESLENNVRKLVEENYSDSMFFDDTKQTMVSVEMQDGYDIAKFRASQQNFVNQLAQVLGLENADQAFKIDPTTIATDLQSVYVGKALGADRFLQFLKDRGINPGKFLTFGDSLSDFEMSDELARKNKKVTHVDVGENRLRSELNKKDYPVEYAGGFNHGTISYLNK